MRVVGALGHRIERVSNGLVTTTGYNVIATQHVLRSWMGSIIYLFTVSYDSGFLRTRMNQNDYVHKCGMLTTRFHVPA